MLIQDYGQIMLKYHQYFEITSERQKLILALIRRGGTVWGNRPPGLEHIIAKL